MKFYFSAYLLGTTINPVVNLGFFRTRFDLLIACEYHVMINIPYWVCVYKAPCAKSALKLNLKIYFSEGI